MRVTDEHSAVSTDEESPEHVDLQVTAHRSSPDRVVFTEDGNTDAWIATDLTVSLEP